MTPPLAVAPVRLAWISDPHLDHATPESYARLVRELQLAEPHVCVVTGDWSNGLTLEGWLTRVEADLPASCGTLVVGLGNHDFYDRPHGEVAYQVARWAADRARQRRVVVLATAPAPLWLTPTVALVGHDGWYDLRAGVGPATAWRITDLAHILEYGSEPGAVASVARRWAAEATAHILAQLDQAVAGGAERVLVATHVPPWAAAALHAGRPSDPEAAPWFVQTDLGDALEAWAAAHPTIPLLVLCGHTHDRARVTLTPTVTCWAAGAVYGAPRVEAVFDVALAPQQPWRDTEPPAGAA